ncbi:helicase domino isoform X2 [Cylas formicarius]|uniref:helicase domino isoform X2 n=1 Tax=Cylas formicarius TaxID=197179 RepID=UPI0029588A51|nr:helicase domino isoform X2 [Cylas formicarius]
MNEDTPGVEQGAPPPMEGQAPQSSVDRPTSMRITQVASGQYVLTPQPHGSSVLTQINSSGLPGSDGAVTRIINISPSRGQTSPLRPSLTNQSIVNVLKARGSSNVRLQLFPNDNGTANHSSPTHARSLKRPSATIIADKDSYSAKLQRVMNHRIVRSKLVKEKYAEHLLEAFYLDAGGNILDLYQYAKRPKSQSYLAYLREHSIDPSDHEEKCSTPTVVAPSATAASSLPGISNTHQVKSPPPLSTPPISAPSTPEPQTIQTKIKSSNSNQEHIVEKAKQEAYVVQRIMDLQRDGLWSEKRLPKLQEMPRAKAHWDFLLEEMVWLAADFAQERKWKKAAAKKCARMVQKHFQDKALAAQKAEKAQEQHLRRIAAFCAKEIKIFWNNVEKLVEYKQHTILEEKRKKALDQQLSFIVDQTEKYSQLLAEGMNKSAVEVPSSTVSSRSVSRAQSDEEFDPEMQSDEDDEETIEQEEAALCAKDQNEEVEALRRESQLELDDLLEDDFLRNYLLNRDNIRLSESESENDKREKKSPSFVAEEEGDSHSDDSNDSFRSGDEKDGCQTENPCLKHLVNEDDGETKTDDEKKDDIINDAAAIAESIQPKGNTLSSTQVSTNIPFLLKLPLREYQHIGLDWLVTMYDRKLNGILADEMGLGKTIQTIALLAHLACEKGNWGPHLIVVPTSVMLNWEMELKKWCPAFKILTYYGTQKERRMKRVGWTKPNTFHVCITSYKLVIQDHQSFRRKRWKYLILDEAQNIKNFKSQRWQLLLNFQTDRRLLLTGTPLQNNLMELWSLMHFLMPNVFQSHREFKEWFSNPVTGMIEGNSEYNDSIIKRLHKVLRPFLLRRLKSEVEKQMPKKYEHVVMCRLSKRQRFLYDDYMSRTKTKETLASGNLLSVINILMQLRKVCNHPNLFEVRPTISSFQCEKINLHIPSIVYEAVRYDPFKHVNLYAMNLLLIMLEIHLNAYQCYRMRQSAKKCFVGNHVKEIHPPCPPCRLSMKLNLKNGEGVKAKKKEQPQNTKVSVVPSNMKMKVSGVQLVSQGIIKTIPLLNISQTNSSGPIQGAAINVPSVLTSADKISANFAQLVQTSTGKHLLLTSNPNITGNIPISSSAIGGSKFTFLSKQPLLTPSGTNQPLTKAFVKFQITSVTTASTITSTNSSTSVLSKTGDKLRSVQSDFLGRLYSKQNNLDIRWSGEEVTDEERENVNSEEKRRLKLMTKVNERRCSSLPLYGRDFQDVIKILVPHRMCSWTGGHIHCLNALFDKNEENTTNFLRNALHNPERRIEQLKSICERFIFYVPAVKSSEAELHVWHPPPSEYWARKHEKQLIQQLCSKPATPLHHIASAMVTQFPDPRLIQYDCGKLQTLDNLLRHLKSENHRVLIFTQMTKMLDVLEVFLNFHGHIYLRLDGSTKIDQRQVLMERFNGDPRIFAFILSTRSGGVGVNLTGADTVIFYDSDWNPTMDAQAQDRCHRIGQTRDVHIYRLVSERTIEENILKKANQKRLLGDLAIEGGNFTTAYFKSSTIQDLFNIDNTVESAAQRMKELTETRQEQDKPPNDSGNVSDDKTMVGALENALAACEDDQDAQAACSAKAEAVADLAEFDENIPFDQDQEKEKEPEISRAEQEISNIIEKLSPIEKYAMKFIEQTESAWSADQLAAAEREIEEQKREWEQNRMAAMREEEKRRAREIENDNEIISYAREDAQNQVWMSEGSLEQMPMWCPPTPPQLETDVYIDHTVSFLYDVNIMSESQLPPIYVKRETKRTRVDADIGLDGRRAAKIPRKDDSVIAPKSLFYSPAILKMKRDLKLQKYRGLMRPLVSMPGKQSAQKSVADQPLYHEWTVHEDMALLKVIQSFQGLPLNLVVMCPGHTPNWDFVAEYVNTVSIAYRSPKQCRQRYENYLMHREEGRYPLIDSILKKKKKTGQLPKFPVQKSGRPARTAQLYAQDNNSTFTQIMNERFETLKAISNRRLSSTRTVINNPLMNKTKNLSTLNECGIDIDRPVLPVEVAARRAERIAKEKKTMTPEQLAKVQMMKGILTAQQAGTTTSAGAQQIASIPIVTIPASQAICQVTTAVTTITAATATTVATSSNLRSPRSMSSPLQGSTLVTVSGLTSAQLQAAAQRLVISPGAANQTKAVLGGTSGTQTKQFSQAQLQMIRQAASIKQQLRLHTGNLTQAVKASTVNIGQQTVVQFTQAQPRAQFVRQGAVTVGTKSGVTRTVTESEVAQLLKKQHQLQQQKLAAAAAGGNSSPGNGGVSGSGGTIHGLTPQALAQAIQQVGGSSGSSVTTLVKAVSSSAGVTQTVTIPVTGVTLNTSGAKTIVPTFKTGSPQQLRHIQIQQQLLAQKKIAGQKLSIAQVGGKTSLPTQLIVGSKPLSTAMTVQQFQQVIRAPLNVSQGPVVLAKGPSRVIPVNTIQGTKQTIQVVSAASQPLSTLHPQSASTLAGALAGIKVPSASNSPQASSGLSQNISVRQNNPVRIQTAAGTPIVAVTVQSAQSGQFQTQSPDPND